MKFLILVNNNRRRIEMSMEAEILTLKESELRMNTKSLFDEKTPFSFPPFPLYRPLFLFSLSSAH